jgi:hypothetical protein
LSWDVEANWRSARRLAELRPRLACFGHGFAFTDPGRFAAAVDQILPSSSWRPAPTAILRFPEHLKNPLASVSTMRPCSFGQRATSHTSAEPEPRTR